jgi:PqqD family protein of HPr-rel-A system
MPTRLVRVPRVSEDVLKRREGDATVLYNEETGEPYLLNETGGRILELVDGKMTIQEIAATLAEEYDAEPDTIRADCVELLELLAGKGLVTFT